MGLIDEISIKRIHIEETIRGHFVSDLSHLVVLMHTCNDKCPNDSRRIMPFVALFLSGSWPESMLWRTLR